MQTEQVAEGSELNGTEVIPAVSVIDDVPKTVPLQSNSS